MLTIHNPVQGHICSILTRYTDAIRYTLYYAPGNDIECHWKDIGDIRAKTPRSVFADGCDITDFTLIFNQFLKTYNHKQN